jgi:mono/diheme cytochrome c family protein
MVAEERAAGGSPRRRWRAWLRRVGLGALALLLLAWLLLDGLLAWNWFAPPPPAPPAGSQLVTLDQGWKEGWGTDGRQWFHHASQGTRIMPYAWFVALEQPVVTLHRDPGPLTAPAYLTRFGFQPGTADARFNPGGRLPVGFAIAEDLRDPIDGSTYRAVGLTCAACHTSRITATGTDRVTRTLLVDGGSAMADLRAFQEAVGRSVLLTLKAPFRFGRFASRVLGEGATGARRDELRRGVQAWFDAAYADSRLADSRHVFPSQSGPARTDALALIGNRVFGGATITDPATGRPRVQNVETADAPVNFPPLWDTSWFDWVQYNGSIRMVMVRNIGEALGVGARTNTDPKSPDFLRSTVDVPNLRRMEDLLGGPEPFRGLRAPRWEDAVARAKFPPLDGERMKRGAVLYGRFCAGCHLPPVAELERDLASAAPRHWTEPGPKPFDRRFLKLPMSDLWEIGTDPAQAVNFAYRTASVTAPDGSGSVITLSAARGLRVVTEAVRTRAYAEAGVDTPEELAAWDRFRDHRPDAAMDQVVVGRLAYKARPLDGVWATAPYLHNGAVPNLDALLRPVDRRPTRFSVGELPFDFEKVGLPGDVRPGQFVLDTTLPGNHHTGHEYRDLTLVELELFGQGEALPLAASPEGRWAKVFGVTPEEYRAMTAAQRAAKVRALTIEALGAANDPKPTTAAQPSVTAESRKALPTFIGVLGPRLEDEERRDLIEYLKSL